MIKGFFMTNDKVHIKRIYRDKVKEKIREKVDIPDEVIDRAIFNSDPDMLKEAKFIFSTWGMPSFTAEEIKKYFPALKAVFYGAGSVQGFARPFLENGIKVFSAWTANGVPVAEFTVSLILLSNKGFFHVMPKTKTSRNEAAGYFKDMPGNYAVKLGIIGAGVIGKKVIELLKPYNIGICVFDPFLPDDAAKGLGVSKCSLDNIFSHCQVISNHLANNQETKGMLNYDYFKLMKPNATFINTGRGAQVVEADLARALKEETGRTAILDVTEPEPPKPDCPLLELENCLMTPHMAGSSGNEVERMGWYMYDELVRYLKGEKLLYEVTLPMLETMA